MMADKKPGLALVIGSKPEDDDESPESESGEFDEAASEFFDALDVETSKRDAARDALKAMIMTCK